MGYNLSATLGFGVKLISYENSDGLFDNREDYDNFEDVLDSSELFSLEYAGTDDCTETFLLINDTIVESSWYNYAIGIPKCDANIILLRNFLDGLEIYPCIEDFKWWMLPRWF